MNYSVYQIEFTPELREDMNSEDGLMYNFYSRISVMPTEGAILKLRNLYKMVAVIDADSLDEVFEISNLGEQEDMITRLADMHSVSVGDVIVDEFGKASYVDTFGFKSIEFNI